jgi:hypothetical protein
VAKQKEELMSDLPEVVQSWFGQKRHIEESELDVDRSQILNGCISVENGNPLFWDEKTAQDLTGGWIAPLSMVSVWCRCHLWTPYRKEEGLSLKLHFDLKEAFDVPESIMSADELVLHKPARPGDRLTSWQVLQSVSEVKQTKVGVGRFWTFDIFYSNQNGELMAKETITGFGYRRTA